MTTSEIVRSIEGRLQAIQVEIRKLTEARKALINHDASMPAPGRGRGSRPGIEMSPTAKLEQRPRQFSQRSHSASPKAMAKLA